jgi:hypothetical protein
MGRSPAALLMDSTYAVGFASGFALLKAQGNGVLSTLCRLRTSCQMMACLYEIRCRFAAYPNDYHVNQLIQHHSEMY